jgi:galactose mutarotase-like enzyme
MDTVVRESSWHGFGAIMLEGEGISATVVPETGGRIVSLFDIENQWEWLLPPEESHAYRKLDPGADFNTTTPGGWDEMFPTILAETYPGPGEFQGVPLPDHGEVWTLPWRVEERSGGKLQMSVEGQALPYRLRRTLAISGAQSLSFQYELTNLGGDPLHYLWAAHPQFACEPGTKIILPSEVKEVVNVLPLEWGEEWGPPGTRNIWPEKVGPEGRRHSQDVVKSTDLSRGRKFYILPSDPISWAGLARLSPDVSLKMEWDSHMIPYCGVWIDEGALNAVPSVAIEPTTAYHDTLNTAAKNRRLAVIGPGAVQDWELIVRLNQITEPI